MIIRCKDCNRELQGHPTRTKCCGCPNMATIRGDRISALDLSHVVMVESNTEAHKSNLERVRLVEDTALKAAGCKSFAGSIPVLSVTKNTKYHLKLSNPNIG